MSDQPTTTAVCEWCGQAWAGYYAAHRRWTCPDTRNRGDLRDACQAAGLPRDAALWLLLDTVAKRKVAAYRADLAARVRGIGHPCHEVCAGELHADCQCAAYVREQALAEIEKETR